MLYQYKTNNLIPELSQIKSVLNLAESPYPELCDQRPLMYILQRLIGSSPRLAGLILTRQTALTSFDWTFTNMSPSDLDKTKPQFDQLIPLILKLIIDSKLFGISAISLRWKLIDGFFYPIFDKYYPPTMLENSVDGVTSLINTLPDMSLIRKPLNLDQNVLLDASTSTINPGGILRTVLLHEYLRDRTLQEWHESNRRIKGLIQAKSPNEQKNQTSEALKSLLTSHFAVTSDSVDLSLKELVSGTAIESFPQFLDVLKTEVAIAILGQANTVELPANGGSRAGLQILNLIRHDILFSDMQSASDVINNQLLLYFYRLNYDKNASYCPFKFQFVFDEIVNIEMNIRTLEFARNINLPISLDDIYRKLVLPKPKISDKIHSFTTPNTEEPT